MYGVGRDIQADMAVDLMRSRRHANQFVVAVLVGEEHATTGITADNVGSSAVIFGIRLREVYRLERAEKPLGYGQLHAERIAEHDNVSAESGNVQRARYVRGLLEP